MAVRFFPDGTFEYLDPYGMGVQSGGGEVYDDGTRMPVWEDRPGQNRNELVANDALRWMSVSRDEIAAIRPSVPQQLFPQTMGYEGVPLTIRDIFESGDYWSPRLRAWISGPPRYMRRIDIEQQGYEGSIRNGSSVNPML